jgi:hypothetical protein
LLSVFSRTIVEACAGNVDDRRAEADRFVSATIVACN